MLGVSAGNNCTVQSSHPEFPRKDLSGDQNHRRGDRMLIFKQTNASATLPSSIARVGSLTADSSQCLSSKIRLPRYQLTRIPMHTLSPSLRLETRNLTPTGPVLAALNVQHPTTVLRRRQNVPLMLQQ